MARHFLSRQRELSGLWNRHGVDHGVKAARRLGRASIHRLLLSIYAFVHRYSHRCRISRLYVVDRIAAEAFAAECKRGAELPLGRSHAHASVVCRDDGFDLVWRHIGNRRVYVALWYIELARLWRAILRGGDIICAIVEQTGAPKRCFNAPRAI